MRVLSPCLSSATVASVSTWSPLVTSGAVPAADMMRYVTCTLCAVGVEPALLPWLGFWPFRGIGVPCWSIWCAGFLSRVVDFFDAAGSQLGQESDDGGRCNLEDKHDAAKKMLEVSLGCLVEFMSWFVCFFPDSGGSGSGASAGSFDGGSEDRCVKFDFLLGPSCNFTLLEFVCCGVCCIFYLLQGVFCKSQDELNIWDPAPSKKKHLLVVLVVIN